MSRTNYSEPESIGQRRAARVHTFSRWYAAVRNADFAASFRVNFLNDNRTVKLYLPSFDGRLPETTTDPAGSDRSGFRRFHGRKYGCSDRCYAHGNDGTFFDNNAFNHFRTAPMKQLSSIMVGFACNGSSSRRYLRHRKDGRFYQSAHRNDGRPGINHGAFINICADVDVDGISTVLRAMNAP